MAREECVVAVAAGVGETFGYQVRGGIGDGWVVSVEDFGDVRVVFCYVGGVIGVKPEIVATCYPVKGVVQ